MDKPPMPDEVLTSYRGIANRPEPARPNIGLPRADLRALVDEIDRLRAALDEELVEETIVVPGSVLESVEDGDVVVVRGTEDFTWTQEALAKLSQWYAEHGKQVLIINLAAGLELEVFTEEAMLAAGWKRA